MNAIIGMTELVRQTDLAADQKESLDIVSTSAHALLDLLNDILDFSKIEAEKLEMSPHPFEIRDFLDDVVRTVVLKAEQKELDLCCRVAREVPSVLIGDAHRLRQVIINLIGNAIKFTDDGEIALDVTLAEDYDGAGVLLRFCVSDTGIGMGPEQQQRIFQPFSQADASVTRRHGGTGLGLTISAGLVHLFGGEIDVTSTPGEGSTFRFTARFGVDRTAVPSAEPVNEDGFAGVRVLIVDHNLRQRRRLAELLGGWGLRPDTAVDAADARQRLQTALAAGDPFRLLLIEHAPPELDAGRFCRECAEGGDEAAPVVILLTTLANVGEARGFELAAIRGHLIKPVKQRELLGVIRAILGGTAPEPASTGADHTADTAPGSKTGGADASDHRPVTRVAERLAASTGADGRAGAPRLPRHLSVLVAEDNGVNQVVARRLLEKAGHAVALVTNGREALDALETGVYDVVLMDVQMPVMDGLEAIRRLRAREETTGEHLPVIALTAHAMTGDRERCLEAGADDYVSKPIDTDALQAAIARVTSAEQPVGS
jgi:CheY-like chemotaxis protein